MKILRPQHAVGLEKLANGRWKCVDPDPGFMFDVPDNVTGFIGFYLSGDPRRLAPQLAFDEGAGISQLTALSLKPFARAFYHVPIGASRRLRCIRFRPCSEPAVFTFIAFSTRSVFLVAILHYLFNLRYQHVALLSRDQAGRRDLVTTVRHNFRRITQFFRQVSKGKGVEVQTSDVGRLESLRLRIAMLANALPPIQSSAAGRPLISFVTPTYNTRIDHLDDLLASFSTQVGGLAELILSDDGSTNPKTLERLERAKAQPGVTVVFNRPNRGIASATNAGIAVTRGAWISFIDHDDQFLPGATSVIAHTIHQNPDAEFFYTDEFVTDQALRPVGVFCKPSYDSVLLSGMNYINHFSIFKRARLDEVGGLDADRDGSQDYDLLLRYMATLEAGTAVHIPAPLYLWRRDEGTYSRTNIDMATRHARNSLEAAYGRAAAPVQVLPALDPNLHRISFATTGRGPLVSVVIPNKNSLPLISRVVADLRQKTNYPSLEIIIVDNGSDDRSVLAFYAQLKEELPSVKVDIQQEAFNFAAMCNRGAAQATGESLLFLNNDIEVTQADWLMEMTACLNFPQAGIVGAKLLYPDGRVQHNGVIVGLGQAAGHWYVGEPADVPGPMGRFHVRQTMSAVTGACMLMTRDCFDAVAGFDAVEFPIAYNDVDLCLRARAAGFRTIWTPFACLTHHESATRGSDESGANNMRFKIELARLQARHRTQTHWDAAYSPLYDRGHSLPHLLLPETLPEPRASPFS